MKTAFFTIRAKLILPKCYPYDFRDFSVHTVNKVIPGVCSFRRVVRLGHVAVDKPRGAPGDTRAVARDEFQDHLHLLQLIGPWLSRTETSNKMFCAPTTQETSLGHLGVFLSEL